MAAITMNSTLFLSHVLSHPILTSFGLLICYLIGGAIYNLYFSPLARYPGPFFAKISSFPNFYYASTGDRHVWIWRCHQKYGTAFRHHPNGVLFSSPDAYRNIHNAKANVKKGKFYEATTRNKDIISTFNTTDKLKHARKRRILTSVFSDKAVRSAETFVLQHLDRWNELLLGDDKETWSPARNMADWCDCLVFDILGDLCFGRSFETKEPEENPLKAIPHTIAGMLKFFYPISQLPILDLWVWLKPRGLDVILQKTAPKDVINFWNFINESTAQRVKTEEEAQKQGLEGPHVRRDMFHYLMNAKDPVTGAAALSRKDLMAEANLLVIAGSDTTAVTLCGIFFYLTRYPHVYARLVAEIRNTFAPVEEICGGTKLNSCQYLRACIDEGLRMCPAGGAELDRVVMRGGQEVLGVWLPEGVHVGCDAWGFLRNEDYFYDPNVYRPERWIVDEKAGVTEDDVARAQSCFFPFSSGPYNCVGKNLAMLEVMVTIARTLYRMDMRALPGDTLGEGSPELPWGRRNRYVFQLTDAWIGLRNGPMVQFKERGV